MPDSQAPIDVYTLAGLQIGLHKDRLARQARETRRSRATMALIVSGIIIAGALVIFTPQLSSTMPAGLYEVMIGAFALFGAVSLFLGVVYYSFSEGHPLKSAFEFVTIVTISVIIATSPPVTDLVNRFFGGIAAVFGH